MTEKLTLLPIDREGLPCGYSHALPELAAELCRATADLYAAAGYEEPWIGYLVHVDDLLVGTCGFKGKPRNDRVEIAYFTFPEFEGRGIATVMAARMRELALRDFGCLEFHTVTEGKEEIALSYWRDEKAIAAWKSHPEHLLAQQAGRNHWYVSYSVQVAEISREYHAAP